MQQTLTFRDITLTPIPYQNNLWIRAAELARALGYGRENQVSRLYRSNADEFTPEMTQVIEIPDGPESGLSVRSRIFSLRGCHLVAMFARTPVAKAFRRWVLDVLEKYAAEQTALSAAPFPDAAISPAERAELKALVDAKLSAAPAAVQGKARAEIWTRFNRHFKIAEYAQLPAGKMPDAREYLIQLSVKALQPSPQPVATALPAASVFAPAVPSTVSPHVLCLSRIEEVRELLRTTCHPGAVTMKMTPQERKAYYACHAAYVAADEALAGAYSILDAGRRIVEAARG